MCVRARRYQVVAVLALWTAYPNAGPTAKAEEARAKFEPADGRVLHGGQHIALYERKAVPYIRATGRECAIISDYVDLSVLGKITPDTLAYVRQTRPKLAESRGYDEVRAAGKAELADECEETVKRADAFLLAYDNCLHVKPNFIYDSRRLPAEQIEKAQAALRQ